MVAVAVGIDVLPLTEQRTEQLFGWIRTSFALAAAHGSCEHIAKMTNQGARPSFSLSSIRVAQRMSVSCSGFS